MGKSAMTEEKLTKEERQALERYISEWHWDKKSHKFAQAMGLYLFEFMDWLDEQGLSEKTVDKHIDNCYWIGYLVCCYGYRKTFSPAKVFYDPDADHEHEFKRKNSDSNYAISSYRSTWRKLYKYTRARYPDPPWDENDK